MIGETHDIIGADGRPGFYIWEARDVASGEPYSVGTRDILDSIELGVHILPDDSIIRAV